MHIVCAIDKVEHGMHYAVIGLLFDEDDNAKDIDMFKTINDKIKHSSTSKTDSHGAVDAHHRVLSAAAVAVDPN
jgi:hypothetical protein